MFGLCKQNVTVSLELMWSQRLQVAQLAKHDTPTRNPQENAPTYKITILCHFANKYTKIQVTPNFHSSFFSLLFFLDCSAVQSHRGLRSRPDSKETSFLENEWGIRILMSYDGVLSSINLVSSCNLLFGSLDLWM